MRIYAPVNRVSIGSGNGLSPSQRQAIISTNAGFLSIGPLGTNFSEILIKILNCSYMYVKISCAKWRPFSPGGDELMWKILIFIHLLVLICKLLILVFESRA